MQSNLGIIKKEKKRGDVMRSLLFARLINAIGTGIRVLFVVHQRTTNLTEATG
jgi:hypothetical protein